MSNKKVIIGKVAQIPKNFTIELFDYDREEDTELRERILEFLPEKKQTTTVVDNLVYQVRHLVGVIKTVSDFPIVYQPRFKKENLKRIKLYIEKLSRELRGISPEDLDILRLNYQIDPATSGYKSCLRKLGVPSNIDSEGGISETIEGTLEALETIYQIISPAAFMPKGNRPKNEVLHYAVSGLVCIYQAQTGKTPKEGGTLQKFILAALSPYYSRKIPTYNLSEAVRDDIQKIKVALQEQP